MPKNGDKRPFNASDAGVATKEDAAAKEARRVRIEAEHARCRASASLLASGPLGTLSGGGASGGSIKGEYDMQQVSLLLAAVAQTIKTFSNTHFKILSYQAQTTSHHFLGLSQVAAALRVITDSVRHSAVDYHQ